MRLATLLLAGAAAGAALLLWRGVYVMEGALWPLPLSIAGAAMLRSARKRGRISSGSRALKVAWTTLYAWSIFAIVATGFPTLLYWGGLIPLIGPVVLILTMVLGIVAIMPAIVLYVVARVVVPLVILVLAAAWGLHVRRGLARME